MSAVRPVALPRRAPDPRPLQRCLLLAALLHVWLVLMFGNTTGSPQAGQGGWGSLSVRLSGPGGGAGEAPPAQARGTPPANATRTPSSPARPLTTERADSGDAPSTATLRLPDGFRPIEQEALRVPPAERSLPELLELPAPVSRLEAAPDAPAPAMPAAASLRSGPRVAELPVTRIALPAPVQRLEAEPVASDTRAVSLPRPAELRPAPVAAAPLAQDIQLPAPVSRLEAATPAPTTAPLPRASSLRAPAPVTLAADAPATSALPAPVQRLEAPADSATDLTRLTQPTALRELAPADTTAAAGSRDLPAPVRRLEAAETAGAVTPLQAGSSPRSLATQDQAAGVEEIRTALPGAVVAPAGPVAGGPAAPALAGTPGDAGGRGSQAGAGHAAAPAAAASAPRAPLNLSLPRGDMTARRSPGLVELLPPPPKRDKVQEALQQAGRPDCRKAYGGGLLAIVPLVVDTVRDKGCKW